MSHFAEIGKDGKVIRVIVAEQDFIDSGAVGDPTNWVQTSYNTEAGVNKIDGIALRGNFAGIGYTYDKTRDAFIGSQPFPSWNLNEKTFQYEPPVPAPLPTGKTIPVWNESKLQWELISKQ